MSRSLLHDWERIENLSVEMSKIAEDIYDTAYARGKNHSDVTKVLEKIKEEIEEAQTHDGIYIDRAYVLEIIDKCKEESEVKERNDDK